MKSVSTPLLRNLDFFKFQKTKDPLSIALYKKKIVKGHDASTGTDGSIFLDAQSGLHKVLEGSYAFHGDTASIYPIIKRTFPEKIICELAEVPLKPTYLQRMSLPIRKRSPYKKLIIFG